MQNNPLRLIQDFSETIAAIFKSFSQICKAHSQKLKESRPDYENLKSQIEAERSQNKRIEYEILNRLNKPSASSSRVRFKNAFQVYYHQEKEKILKEHPSLGMQKIASLASIKWKRMKREQQLAFQKKMVEYNKLTDEDFEMDKKKYSEEAVYIKKQYNQDEEEDRQQDHHQKENQQPNNNEENQSHNVNNFESSHEGHARDNDVSRQQMRINEQSAQSHPQLQVQNTLMMENEYENDPTLQMADHQEPPKDDWQQQNENSSQNPGSVLKEESDQEEE